MIIDRAFAPAEVSDSARDEAGKALAPRGAMRSTDNDPSRLPSVYPPFEDFFPATDGVLWTRRVVEGDSVVRTYRVSVGLPGNDTPDGEFTIAGGEPGEVDMITGATISSRTIIDAINEDLPIDRFLTEQIAGDLLYPDTVDGIEALGLLEQLAWGLLDRAVRVVPAVIDDHAGEWMGGFAEGLGGGHGFGRRRA